MTVSLSKSPSTSDSSPKPIGNTDGLKRYWQPDLLSGFLVFLIALPLCLAISLASGFPAIAGVMTAIVGGAVGSLVSNSELTIKGPAAGLIVIVLGCVSELGYTGGVNPTADFAAYRGALAVGVAAAMLQIVFSFLRAGILSEFFPTAAIHGLLASIGIIIISKQIPVAVGLKASGEPLELLRRIPQTLDNMNPYIAVIGAISLLILFLKPLIQQRWIKLIPGQLIVILLAVPMGIYFDLSHEHTYSLNHHTFTIGEQHLVNVPFNLLGAFTFPDFAALNNPIAWKWVMMFALIGTLESLLSAKAVESLDPWKRRTNADRDLLSVGMGNLISAFIGGLPMISEIVRSRANIDNGAKTRFANLYHGLCLLLAVALLPAIIHRIPLAALAAMLIYTGFRLAHPREFLHIWRVGPEQFVVFVTTIIAVLASDLLIGIGVGMALEIAIQLLNGVPINSLFRSRYQLQTVPDSAPQIHISDAVVFSNWLTLRRQIVELGKDNSHQVILNFSGARFVDHTVMAQLERLREELSQANCDLTILGLDQLDAVSNHPLSARRMPTAESISKRLLKDVSPRSMIDE